MSRSRSIGIGFRAALPVYAVSALGRRRTMVTWPGLLRYVQPRQARLPVRRCRETVDRGYGRLQSGP